MQMTLNKIMNNKLGKIIEFAVSVIAGETLRNPVPHSSPSSPIQDPSLPSVGQ